MTKQSEVSQSPTNPNIAEPTGNTVLAASGTGELSSREVFLIDFAQGLTIGSLFYFLALLIFKTLTPDAVLPMLALTMVLFFGQIFRMQWREAALTFGAAVGVASNLLTPILLFLVYLLGWIRPTRSHTTPWAALGLSLYLVAAVLSEPVVIAELATPVAAQAYDYYLLPLAISTTGCAVLSQTALLRHHRTETKPSIIYKRMRRLMSATVLLALAGMVGMLI